MVLQADIPESGMILVGDVELMFGTVGSVVGNRPLVQVHPRDNLPVKLDRKLWPVARDLHMVPLANGLHDVFRRFDQVVDRAGIVVAGRLGVVDRDLDAVEADILARPRREGMRQDKYATVAASTDLEIECEHKVRPDLTVNEHITTASMRIEAAIFDRYIARLAATGQPSIQALAVEQENPGGLLFVRAECLIGCRG